METDLSSSKGSLPLFRSFFVYLLVYSKRKRALIQQTAVRLFNGGNLVSHNESIFSAVLDYVDETENEKLQSGRWLKRVHVRVNPIKMKFDSILNLKLI